MFLLMELYLSKVHLTSTAVMMQYICCKNIMNRSSAYPLTSMQLIRYDSIINQPAVAQYGPRPILQNCGLKAAGIEILGT